MKKTLFLVALLASGLSAKAQLIDIQFGGAYLDDGNAANVQSGVGIIGSAGDQWNDLTSSSITSQGFFDTTGTTVTGAALTVTGTSNSVYQYSDVNDGNPSADTLGSTTVYNLASGELGDNSTLTLSFAGLPHNTTYSIDLLTAPDRWERSASWAVNGGTSQTAAPLNSGPGGVAPTSLDYGLNYLTFTGTTDSTGALTIAGTSISGDVNINGLQLQAEVVPEPSTYALMLGGILVLIALRRKSRLSV